MNFKTFGDKIKEYRTLYGKTQKDYKVVDVGKSYASKLENNLQDAPIETKRRLFLLFKSWALEKNLDFEESFEDFIMSVDEQKVELIKSRLLSADSDKDFIDLIDFAEENNLEYQIVEICENYYYFLDKKGNPNTALKYLYKKLELENRLNLDYFLTYNKIGNCLSDLAQYESAVINYKLALDCEIEDPEVRYNIMLNIAYKYRKMKKYDDERKIVEEVLVHAKDNPDTYCKAIILLSSIDEDMHKIVDNTEYLIEIINDVKYKKYKHLALNNLGYYYYVKGNYSEALHYFVNAKEYKKEYNYPGYYDTVISIARVYLELGDDTNFLTTFKESVGHIDELSSGVYEWLYFKYSIKAKIITCMLADIRRVFIEYSDYLSKGKDMNLFFKLKDYTLNEMADNFDLTHEGYKDIFLSIAALKPQS